MVAICLSTGQPLIAYSSSDELRIILRMFLAMTIIDRLREYVLSLPSGYRVRRRATQGSLWLVLYTTVATIRTFLPSRHSGLWASFQSTGTLRSPLNERSSQLRAPLFRRLITILWTHGAYMHLLYLGIYTIAFSINIRTSLYAENAASYLPTNNSDSQQRHHSPVP